MPNLPHPDKSDNFEGDADNSLLDLTAARRYLSEKSRMCAKAAASADPREIWLALGIVQNRSGGRMRRTREIFVLECGHCHKHIEIAVAGPHCCPLCKEVLVIECRPK